MTSIKWDCDQQIKDSIAKVKQELNEYIQTLHICALSKSLQETDKKITKDLIDNFLKKRGYTLNYMLGKVVMTKGFTCVCVRDDSVEIWHDKTNNNKSIFINHSLLTGLPIVLNYMERI